MKVVVVGSTGLLGFATVREWRDHGFDVAALTRTDLDVSQHAHVAAVIGRLSPAVLINCTAYNRVDDAEDDPSAAFAGNAWAVRSLARAAQACGAAFVHYSTDFVFDGTTARPYTEEDAPNPLGVYGTSKLLGEWLAADAPRHYVLRVESLFGGSAARSSVDRMIEALRTGQQVIAFADRAVSPSYVADVAYATRRLVTGACPAGLYHCVNSGQTTWVGIAEALRELLALTDADIVISRASDVKMRAARPMFAALANDKLTTLGIPMPSWQDALARHIRANFVGRGL